MALDHEKLHTVLECELLDPLFERLDSEIRSREEKKAMRDRAVEVARETLETKHRSP